ncbi:MAG: CoA pyrophosphatase [Hyphomicrobiales bacterium]|nr:CoA pyrophosphatase [Hyphomicrobiales bacterium]OQW80677.1 MAG: CoA pyrophosphatase [Proteobacteria bacterium ST_bin15]
MRAAGFALNDFIDRARVRLDPSPLFGEETADRGDHELDPTLISLRAPGPRKLAAVLVGIINRDEPSLLLTQRTSHLPSHAGQIAFPGGKIDADDASPLMAALREAEEEVGLHRGHVDCLGYLDPYQTTTGFRIMPVVALVDPGHRLTLNENEVADAFEVPLAFLMDPANHQEHSREFRGRDRHYYAMPFGERYIWGATAGMIRRLYQRLYTDQT